MIPSTKHIESRMLDLPEPFLCKKERLFSLSLAASSRTYGLHTYSPVMALKDGSHPAMLVRTG